MKFKNNIFLSILFIAMSFFLMFSIYTIEKNLKLQLNESVFLGDDSLNFTIKCNNGKRIDDKILKLNNQYMIMRDDLGELKQYAIYFKGKLNKEPKMIKGRFLDEDDFNKNSKLVVIGKNLDGEIVEKNGEDYFYIENEYYKVIGIMGDNKEETSYDSSIYINLDSLIKDDTSIYLQGNYILQSKGKNEEIFQTIKKLYEDKNVIVKEKINQNQSPISKILNKIDVYSVENIIKVVIVLILNVSVITTYWIRNESRIIGIKRAMGATKKKISIEVLKELTTVSITSFFIGYLLYIVIAYIRDEYVKFYFVTMAIVFAITIITTLIAAGISIYNINKMEPSKIMRC